MRDIYTTESAKRMIKIGSTLQDIFNDAEIGRADKLMFIRIIRDNANELIDKLKGEKE